MDIEEIFQDELRKYERIAFYFNSLLLQSKDLYTQFERSAEDLKTLLSSKSFTSKDLSSFLEAHIAIVSNINSLNKEIYEFYQLIQKGTNETST